MLKSNKKCEKKNKKYKKYKIIQNNEIINNNKIIQKDEIKNNLYRQIYNFLSEYIDFKKLKGFMYYYLHGLFIFFIGIITFFSTSKLELIIMLVIISLDAISIIYLHECPLTTLEKKYLGYSGCEERDDILKKINIMYNCEHTYEKQIELVINVWCIIAMKCLAIMFFNMFDFKIVDSSNIYA